MQIANITSIFKCANEVDFCNWILIGLMLKSVNLKSGGLFRWKKFVSMFKSAVGLVAYWIPTEIWICIKWTEKSAVAFRIWNIIKNLLLHVILYKPNRFQFYWIKTDFFVKKIKRNRKPTQLKSIKIKVNLHKNLFLISLLALLLINMRLCKLYSTLYCKCTTNPSELSIACNMRNVTL